MAGLGLDGQPTGRVPGAEVVSRISPENSGTPLIGRREGQGLA